MNDLSPDQTDPDLQRLDRLVGTWQITGDATGTVSYRWLTGGHFLAQEGELDSADGPHRFLEIIGRLRPFGAPPSEDLWSRSYGSGGETLDYVYKIEGDTLTIWSGHRGSVASYAGTFSADDTVLEGRWTWPGGGYATTSTRVSPNAEDVQPAGESR